MKKIFFISIFLSVFLYLELHAGYIKLRKVTGSSFQDSKEEFSPEKAADGDMKTRWSSGFSDPQWLQLDFGEEKVINKVVLNWETSYGKSYQVQVSLDGKKWYVVYSTDTGDGDRDIISFKPVAVRYLRIYGLLRAKVWGFSLWEVEVQETGESADTLSDFPLFEERSVLNSLKANPVSYYLYKAKLMPKGYYPRWFYDEFNFWTVIGDPDSAYESLFSDEGMIGCYKNGFSLIPYLYIKRTLITPFETEAITYSLDDNYLPAAEVKWDCEEVIFKQKLFSGHFSDGKTANYILYTVINKKTKEVSGKFYLTIRPFQVTPLNMYGGFVRINSIDIKKDIIQINNKFGFAAYQVPEKAGVLAYDAGDIMDYLAKGMVPDNKTAECKSGFAAGALEYEFTLKPGEKKEYHFIIPLDSDINNYQLSLKRADFNKAYQQSSTEWQELLNKIKINIPDKAIVNTFRANLAYILIQKDGSALQPGSRNYDRSWMRDGAVMGSALLRSGHFDIVRKYLEWVTGFQYANGRIPPILYSEGYEADKDKTLNEYDGQGAYIFLAADYYKFTRDKEFLEKNFSSVVKALQYLEMLRKQRLTSEFRTGAKDKQRLYGILPESISHEGYSEPGRHSYWDDYWALKGWDEAVRMAEILGKQDLILWMEKERKDFQQCLYDSIKKSLKDKNIKYIPGCAELGDFDATSTAICVWPTEQAEILDHKDLLYTLDKYYQEIFTPRVEKGLIYGYTPYEMRTAIAYLMLGQKEKTLKMINYFLTDRRPLNWNHWAETVHPGYRETKYVGDIPHSWIGGIYLNLIRHLFVYEKDGQLILGAGIDEKWLDKDNTLSVQDLPTYFGTISYTMKADKGKVIINIAGNALPENGFIFKSPYLKKDIKQVEIDGKKAEQRIKNQVGFKSLPAEIIMYY